MAVEIEFVNVIIRKTALEEKYKNGLDGFLSLSLPNYIQDDQIVRVGYMSTKEAVNLMDDLHEHGLTSDDFACLTKSCPEWLSVGKIEGSHCCWLKGSEPLPVVKNINGFWLVCPSGLYAKLENTFKEYLIGILRTQSDEGNERLLLTMPK